MARPLLLAGVRASRWWETARQLGARDAALERVLSWIRTIALEDDVFYLATPRRAGYVRFPFPSYPKSRPVRVGGAVEPSRVRFVVRSGVGDGGPDVEDPAWRPILSLRGLTLFQRDAPVTHEGDRPLRLGVTEAEGWTVLTHARRCAEAVVAGSRAPVASPVATGDLSRLHQRSAMAVALWTRGRLRGSALCPPAPVLRATAQAARWASKDGRFPPLSTADLEGTLFQVSFLHAPSVPLSSREIETADAYPDKAAFVSKGTRSGLYLPEIFNVRPLRSLRAFATSLAREKAGLDGFGEGVSLDVCEVTELVESAHRSRAVRLDGPVASARGLGNERTDWRASGDAACAWLAAIQHEDGSLPLRVHPLSGKADGVDLPRMALTAQALAAFGVARGLESALETARRVNAWLDRSDVPKPKPAHGLLITSYRGKAALCLGDEDTARNAVKEAVRALDAGAPREPLVLAHVASLLLTMPGHPESARRGAALRSELLDRFTQAKGSGAPVSLAEWAELAAAFPADSQPSRDVAAWLTSKQLRSGAFPETTTSDFVYTRGTSKVLEVLALHPRVSASAIERCLRWLRSMQYRPDSMFFVPEEHRPRVEGGLRHDLFDTAAWIDSAAHLLLGLARLEAG